MHGGTGLMCVCKTAMRRRKQLKQSRPPKGNKRPVNLAFADKKKAKK